ncbi:MAG: hypothetical protein QNK37_00965 [Acidobacteriota bacterium]|nr:hypothetical protein [Acidobacteriota bacterium]
MPKALKLEDLKVKSFKTATKEVKGGVPFSYPFNCPTEWWTNQYVICAC